MDRLGPQQVINSQGLYINQMIIAEQQTSEYRNKQIDLSFSHFELENSSNSTN